MWHLKLRTDRAFLDNENAGAKPSRHTGSFAEGGHGAAVQISYAKLRRSAA